MKLPLSLFNSKDGGFYFIVEISLNNFKFYLFEQVKFSLFVCKANSMILCVCVKVGNPRVELTLSELQEMAMRQQQQIETQQQMLIAKVGATV